MAGSFSTPVSMPFSQRSHQRSASCRKPIAGLGTAKCGYLWIHGPTMPLAGASIPLDQARHGVLVAVAPAADGSVGGLDARKNPRRPSRVSNRRRGAGVSARAPAGMVRSPAGRATCRASVVAGDRRVRRPRRIGQHGRAPAHVLVEQAGRPCSGCRRHSGRSVEHSVMMAFSAGGCIAATCSELKPPQEMPIMPTLPLHQGWRPPRR